MGEAAWSRVERVRCLFTSGRVGLETHPPLPPAVHLGADPEWTGGSPRQEFRRALWAGRWNGKP